MLTAAIVDSREPDNIRALKFGGVPVAVTALDCGDLWASCDDGNMLVIERKAPSDLLNSIKDGRLFQQSAALRQRSVWAYLVVTDVLTDTADGHVMADSRTTGWRWADVQGALLTVQDLGVSVLSCPSDAAYEAVILALARRERNAEKCLAPRTQGRVLTPAEQILTSLPGIGLGRAQAVLDHWDGNPAHALAWLTWMGTVLEIDGIGNGTKQGVRRALGLQPDEWLTVFDSEKAEYAANNLATGTPPHETANLVDVRAQAAPSQPQGGAGGSVQNGRRNGREV